MTYQNRRGPNVSHFAANLNAINPLITDNQPAKFEVQSPEDLSLFTNTQFFDFDMGDQMASSNAANSGRDFEQKTEMKAEKDEYDFNALLNGDFNNFDLLPILQDDNFNVNFQQDSAQHQHQNQQQQDLHAPGEQNIQRNSAKRKASSSSLSPSPPLHDKQQVSLEEASRLAAEEDKRRRNTAASARFRIKKKQREQAMEQHAKDLEQKCQTLEARVSQLEMENKWLKNLVVEKNTSTSRDDTTSISTSTKDGMDGLGTRTEKGAK